MARTKRDLEYAKQLGDFMRERRTAAGMTVRKLAELAGVDQAGISRMEHGERMPRVSSLQRLADVLKLDMAELLAIRGVAVTHTASGELRTYLRACYRLPDEAIAEAEDAIFEIYLRSWEKRGVGNRQREPD